MVERCLLVLSSFWFLHDLIFVLQTDPEFDLDIKEDVGEECSKFGRVRHIYVDKYVSTFWYKYLSSCLHWSIYCICCPKKLLL